MLFMTSYLCASILVSTAFQLVVKPKFFEQVLPIPDFGKAEV